MVKAKKITNDEIMSVLTASNVKSFAEIENEKQLETITNLLEDILR
jgi:hypothetical protein